MIAKSADLIESIHPNPKATEHTLDRGSIVNVQRTNDRGLVMFVVENPEKARKLFKAKRRDTVGVISDHPSLFGLSLLFVEDMPEPHRSKWRTELTSHMTK